MKTKDVLLAAFLIVGFALFVKMLQVSVTSEFWDWLTVAADLLLESAGVKVLVIALGFLFCLSLIALAWDKAERRYLRRVVRDRLTAEDESRGRLARAESDEADESGPRAA